MSLYKTPIKDQFGNEHGYYYSPYKPAPIQQQQLILPLGTFFVMVWAIIITFGVLLK